MALLAQAKYNMNTHTKKKYIENNNAFLPFLANKNHVSVSVSTSRISVLTLTKNRNSENPFLYQLKDSSTQESDDSMILDFLNLLYLLYLPIEK